MAEGRWHGSTPRDLGASHPRVVAPRTPLTAPANSRRVMFMHAPWHGAVAAWHESSTATNLLGEPPGGVPQGGSEARRPAGAPPVRTAAGTASLLTTSMPRRRRRSGASHPRSENG